MAGESLYYGLNALSNNMIMVDRKKLKNPNGLILGTPGSGKSFAAKREITNAFFVTKDDIIIGDPEGEYYLSLIHILIGDQRTAMFVIISDTDDTFNFVVAIMYTQLFNLLCDNCLLYTSCLAY